MRCTADNAELPQEFLGTASFLPLTTMLELDDGVPQVYERARYSRFCAFKDTSRSRQDTGEFFSSPGGRRDIRRMDFLVVKGAYLKEAMIL